MGRITIAVYKPKPGMEKELLAMVKKHLPVLQKENLVTDRKPIVMRAADQSIVEIFEWVSPEAIQAAHTNKNVGKLWEEFGAVCDYSPPVAVQEFHNMFSEFESIN
jgi:hypothetical protein